MSKLNIIIIARNILPRISPRSFRATELAKEMAKCGHNVTLYAVLGNYDYTKFQEETGVTVKNIGKMLFATSNSDGRSRNNVIDKILYHSLHRFIEFPDIEFLIKVPKIIQQESNANLLITIAFPHPIHWGASFAKAILSKNKFPKVWISDCGDPYIGDRMNVRKFFYFKFIEKWWCRSTNFITIPIDSAIEGYFNQFHNKIHVIPQGFELANTKIAPYIQHEKITFAYSGSIYPGTRDPSKFLNYLTTLKIDFKLIIYSNNSQYFQTFQSLLKEKLEIRPYIPREELIFELSKMDFLINFKNKDSIQLPSKLIDYMLTKRPILEISSGFPINEQKQFLNFMNQNYNEKFVGPNIEEYDIKNIAQRFIHLYYADQGQKTKY